jgi:hypothetical protein
MPCRSRLLLAERLAARVPIGELADGRPVTETGGQCSKTTSLERGCPQHRQRSPAAGRPA